jgi:hypothetical protein
MAVPLSQLAAVDPDATAEAIGDWHYWAARGYLFWIFSRTHAVMPLRRKLTEEEASVRASMARRANAKIASDIFRYQPARLLNSEGEISTSIDRALLIHAPIRASPGWVSQATAVKLCQDSVVQSRRSVL